MREKRAPGGANLTSRFTKQRQPRACPDRPATVLHGNVTSHADRHGHDCPSAPAMQQPAGRPPPLATKAWTASTRAAASPAPPDCCIRCDAAVCDARIGPPLAAGLERFRLSDDGTRAASGDACNRSAAGVTEVGNRWPEAPAIRAEQGSRNHARDARRGIRAGLAPDPITGWRAAVGAAGSRLMQQSGGAGDAAPLVLAVQAFVANGGGRPASCCIAGADGQSWPCRSAWLLAFKGAVSATRSWSPRTAGASRATRGRTL
jgi:hypothetical protein